MTITKSAWRALPPAVEFYLEQVLNSRRIGWAVVLFCGSWLVFSFLYPLAAASVQMPELWLQSGQNTLLCLLVLGLMMACPRTANPGTPPTACTLVLPITVLCISVTVLLQAAFNLYPADGFWRLLVNTLPSDTQWPGRMTTPAAIAMVCYASAWILLHSRALRSLALTGMLTAIGTGLTFGSAIGHIFELPFIKLYPLPAFTLAIIGMTIALCVLRHPSYRAWEKVRPGQGVFVRVTALLALLSITSGIAATSYILQEQSIRALIIVSLFCLVALSIIYQRIVSAVDQRTAAEHATRLKQQDLERAQALAGLGSWKLQTDTGVLQASKELLRLFGLSDHDEIHRQALMDKVAACDHDLVQACWHGAMTGRGFDLEYRVNHDNGQLWVRERVTVQCSKAGRILSAAGTVQDISTLKAKEQELIASREQIRSLADHNEQVREVERRRIASELHDEMGQLLTALRLDISLTRMQFGHLHTDLEQQLETLKCSVDQVIRSTRTVAASLRPPALDLGLKEAAEWLIDTMRQRTGITCHLLYKMDNEQLDERIRTTAYRVLQESLTNVIKHAQATDLQIRIIGRDDCLELTVSDNGHGFSPVAIDRTRSFGLAGMTERISALGGTLEINSKPGSGTTINASIPLNTTHRRVSNDISNFYR